jgi:hypothetical protein
MRRIADMIARDTCVVLDGATGTEIPRRADIDVLTDDDALWGTRALLAIPG